MPFLPLALVLGMASCSGERASEAPQDAPAGETSAQTATLTALADPASDHAATDHAPTDHAYVEGLYGKYCAACHEGAVREAPTRAALETYAPNALLAAMTTGIMREQARAVSSFDKERLANHLGAAALDQTRRAADVQRCDGALAFAGGRAWPRWGATPENTRHVDAATRISAETAPQLKLKWAFGYPGAARARSQPAVVEEAIFLGSQDGTVYALDRERGCVWWRFFAEAEVRVAPNIAFDEAGRAQTLYFADFEANVYAVDAVTGEEKWRRSVKDHPVGTITGSPSLHEDMLFVPMSSLEVVSAYMTDYPCCTFRGGVVALNADTGAIEWRFFTTPEPQRRGENAEGAPMWGPSGAPVWSPPTIDADRRLIYVGTGENYSSPATELSDAILALRMEDGALAWSFQATPDDAWNGACGSSRVNCPEEDGPDFDFGAPPVLATTPDGRDIILAGQKSGMVYALDPDADGKLLWRRRAGMGGFNGGVHWGMASDGETVFVGIADTPGHKDAIGPAQPGVHAYDVASGEAVWSVVEPETCDTGERKCQTAMSAAVTLAADVVLAGALNGALRAYNARNGAALWSFDAMREFETVNGVKARGGSIDSDGFVVFGDMAFVNAGYDKFGNIPGNALLAFEIEE
ncbi:MAG: PQQ-binding-like beta-propeller repeat protein [Pseudomonadota bacterium]